MFAKNIVVRLHVFLIIFTLAFSQPYAYASAAPAPKLDFVQIQNFVRTAGAATADYLFKKSANDPSYNAANDSTYWKKKPHTVTNSALGVVAFKRILGLTVFGIAAGFAVDEIVSRLTQEGWTVDKANQEIFKSTGGWCVRTSTSPHPPVSSGAYLYCSESPVSSVNQYLLFRNPKVKDNAFVPTSTGGYHNNYTQFSSPRLYGDVFSDTTAVEVRVNIDSCDSGGCNPITAFGQIFLDKVPSGKILATPDDVAEVLPKVSDAQIASLMTSPDYIAESHSPTASAAAAAAPSSEPLPQSTAGINPNPFALPAPNAPPTTNPNPDPNAPPTTNPPPTPTPTPTTPPAPVSPPLPAFCVYAPALCEWLNWTKEAPNPPTDTKVTIVESSTELDSNQRINWSGGCPSDPVVSLPLGMPDLELKFFSSFMCPWAEMMRPVFLFSGALISIYIVTGRGMSNG